MGSKQIKIIVTLLVVAAAIAAAFFVHPKRFHMDRTQYELISLHKPEYRSAEVYAINSSGVAVGRIEYPDGTVEIVKWDSVGTREVVSMPENDRIYPGDINNKGDFVGNFQSRQGNGVEDPFHWNPVRGFQLLRACETLQSEFFSSISINDKGQISGNYYNKSLRKFGGYFFDPTDGLRDIGSLGSSHVLLGGMNEDGTIVGWSVTIGSTFHAFLWTKRDGIKDIHSVVDPQAISTLARAISFDGWILIQASYRKGNNRIIWYHPQKGIGPSFSFNESIMDMKPVASMNRFIFRSEKPGWTIGSIVLRPSVQSNWILDYGQKPVLITPKVLSGKSWNIVGMTVQGLIVGRFEYKMINGINQFCPQAFLLRPIRPGDSGKK